MLGKPPGRFTLISTARIIGKNARPEVRRPHSTTSLLGHSEQSNVLFLREWRNTGLVSPTEKPRV